MIYFYVRENKMICMYTPEMSANWIADELQKSNHVTLKRSLRFTEDLLLSTEPNYHVDEDDYEAIDEAESSYFLFAEREGEYFKVKRGVLVDSFDVFIHVSIVPIIEFFVAEKNISIFSVIGRIDTNDFYLGGEHPTAIPIEAFEKLIKAFPNKYELVKYVDARVASVLRNYFDTVVDAESKYQKYLNNKFAVGYSPGLLNLFQEEEIQKYETILGRLENMLKEENGYSERQWQNEILQIILLLYPKYLFAFPSVPVRAKYEDGSKVKQLDFLLVDYNGHIDILEIKKPFNNAIMTDGVYRDNHIPLRELSGTVMQIEKYIYFLNRWSVEGEKYLTDKFKKKLPENFNIKITNPSGLIIMGRENNLTPEQKRDFEVVKRKYKNVIDIITYDALLYRLRATIEQLRKL